MATLTPTQISQDIVEAIAVQVPMLRNFTTDFTSERKHLNQQVIAHLDSVPAVGTYNATTGYANGAVEANTLLTDIPVTLDQHKHVTLKFDHLNAIADAKVPYQESISKKAYALGKAIVDFALGKVVAANFTKTSVETVANTDRDTLGTVRKAMNANGALASGRYGIVTSDFAEALDADARIASRDYYGQQTAGEAYLHLRNVAGFGDIYEYPDLLTAAGGNLSGFFADPRAIVVSTALPSHSEELAAQLGIPQNGISRVVSDPATGISLLSIVWQDPPTRDLFLTLTALYGAVAGANGGGANALLDKTGYRITTA